MEPAPAWGNPLHFLTLIAALAFAGPLGAQDSLGRGVPEDYFLAWRRFANPERSWLDARLAAARDEWVKGNLSGAIVEALAEAKGDDAARRAFRQEADQWRLILERVPWGKLLEREYLLALRFSIQGDAGRGEGNRFLDADPRFDWIALFRVPAAERDSLIRSLQRVVVLLGTLQLDDDGSGRQVGLEVTEGELDGSPVSLLASARGEAILALAGAGDVIALSSSPRELRRSLRLLAGEGSGIGLAATREFERSMAGLARAEDGELLFRPGVIFEQFSAAAKQVETAAVRDDRLAEVETVVRVLRGIVEGLDLVRSVSATESTEPGRLVGSFRIELEKEAPGRPLGAALLDRPPLEDLGRLVPQGAVGFFATSGADLPKLHDAACGFIEKVFPQGKALLDDYRRAQEKNGLNLRDEILSLFEGRAVLLLFDSKLMPRPLLLLRLKDPAAATKKFGEWAEKGKALGFPSEAATIAETPGDFRKIILPGPAGLELYLGIAAGELVAAGSPEDIRSALAVRSGKGGSIRDDPEFQRLALPLGEPLQAAAYLKISTMVGSLGFPSLTAMAGHLGIDRETMERLQPAAIKAAPILLNLLSPFNRAGLVLRRIPEGFRGEAAVTVHQDAVPDPKAPTKKRQDF